MSDTKEILIEIGTEEIPARMMEDALQLLEDDLDQWTKDKRLPNSDFDVMGTPRRFVIDGEFPVQQEDDSEIVKGPPVQVAYENDDPTEALRGFCQQHDAELESVSTRNLDGGEYVVLEREIAGKTVEDVFRDSFGKVVMDLDWPKTMRWESTGATFIRPIRWVLAFCGEDQLDLEVGPVKSGSESGGLRFTDQERVTVDSIQEYREMFVESTDLIHLDQQDRRNFILERAESLCEEVGGRPVYDEDLLDEVTHLVESPTPFRAPFAERFLDVPDPVLIKSMQSHQKYFPVEDDEGLLPYFIGVRNGGDRHLESVKEGNRKVLRARLNDAEFFYEKDLQTGYEEYREQLKGVVFQEELGSLFEKTSRMEDFVDQVCKNNLSDDFLRAVRHCKNDLVTDMVEEFPDLQGIIGKYYARESGWDEDTAQYIEEHYKPRGRQDPLPGQNSRSSDQGSVSYESCIISLVDRMDTLVGFFGLGKRATGSSDPFGLRRDALSVIRILREEEFDDEQWNLNRLISISRDVHSQYGFEISDQSIEDLRSFFQERLMNHLRDVTDSHEILRATVPRFWQTPRKAVRRIKWLQSWAGDDRFEDVLTGYERVHNLAEKLAEPTEPDPDLFTKDEEEELWQFYEENSDDLERALDNREPDRIIEVLSELRDYVDRYFEEVMVMVDDDQLKQNRLATLNKMEELYDRVAGFSAFL